MVVSRLLFAKLVAWKPKNGESMTFQLLMQCIQFCKKKKQRDDRIMAWIIFELLGIQTTRYKRIIADLESLMMIIPLQNVVQ